MLPLRRPCSSGFANGATRRCGSHARGLPPLRGPRGRSQLRVVAESPIVDDMDQRGGDDVAGPSAAVLGSAMGARPVFNRERWAYHRNTDRYARHMLSIFKSVTFRNLQAPLSFLSLNACLVVIYRTAVDHGWLPDLLFEGVVITDVPFQLTSFALSLLLVFRTDASYDRWCTAMDAWGSLRSSSGALVRKAASWVHNRAHLNRVVRWVSAYLRTLMLSLRHDMGSPSLDAAVREELRQLLRPHELEQVLAAGPYYPQFCLSVLTALVETSHVGESRETAMLADLDAFSAAAGVCEKVIRFPIPLTYTRHTSRFMLIYLTGLPLALYDSCDWAVVPVTVLVAFLLLGIEDIGVQIEEPFTILPLEAICGDIDHTCRRTVNQRDTVRCLADPDTCSWDPSTADEEEREARAAAAAAAGAGPAPASSSGSSSSSAEGWAARAAVLVGARAGPAAGGIGGSSNGNGVYGEGPAMRGGKGSSVDA